MLAHSPFHCKVVSMALQGRSRNANAHCSSRQAESLEGDHPPSNLPDSLSCSSIFIRCCSSCFILEGDAKQRKKCFGKETGETTLRMMATLLFDYTRIAAAPAEADFAPARITTSFFARIPYSLQIRPSTRLG